MRRSKSMITVAAIGLVLGATMVLVGWDGVLRLLRLVEARGDRLVGGLLVVFSIAVLARQLRATPSGPQTENRGGISPGDLPKA